MNEKAVPSDNLKNNLYAIYQRVVNTSPMISFEGLGPAMCLKLNIHYFSDNY
jgi:hypothetical protein